MSSAGFDWIRTVLITRAKRYLTQLWPVKSLPDNSFIILCRPRTGSTLLHTYLNSHPAIYSYGELLRRNQEKGVASTLDREVFKRHPPMIKAVGLKVFYTYLDLPDYRPTVFELAASTDIKVIHLKRKNALDEYISLQKAKASDRWSQTRMDQKNEKWHHVPDASDFLEFLRLRKFSDNRARYFFEDHQILDLYYEDLMEDRDRTLLEVQKFLGVKPRRLFSLLVKQGDPSHTDVSNYEELATTYKDFLESDKGAT